MKDKLADLLFLIKTDPKAKLIACCIASLFVGVVVGASL